MNPLIRSLIAAIIVSVISLVGIPFAYIGIKTRHNINFILIALAAGVLVGGGFLHMLPEASEEIGSNKTAWMIVLGLSIFFLIERLLRWGHCHKDKCEIHPMAYLNLIGDGFHNLFDGIIIAAAFLAGPDMGVFMTILIIMHEIPQEIGDIGVLLHAGVSLRAAALLNLASAVLAILGVVLGYFFLSSLSGAVPYIIALAAGGFLYIAMSDLIPELHLQKDDKRAWIAFAVFLLGVILMGAVKWIAANLS